MSTDMRGAVLGVGLTFSTITNIISFFSGEHSHTVCFEVLVELPWIGMVACYSTGDNALSSEVFPGGYSTQCHHALCQLGKQIRPNARSELWGRVWSGFRGARDVESNAYEIHSVQRVLSRSRE